MVFLKVKFISVQNVKKLWSFLHKGCVDEETGVKAMLPMLREAQWAEVVFCKDLLII